MRIAFREIDLGIEVGSCWQSQQASFLFWMNKTLYKTKQSFTTLPVKTGIKIPEGITTKPQQLPKQSSQKNKRQKHKEEPNAGQQTSSNNQHNPNSLQGKSGY